MLSSPFHPSFLAFIYILYGQYLQRLFGRHTTLLSLAAASASRWSWSWCWPNGRVSIFIWQYIYPPCSNYYCILYTKKHGGYIGEKIKGESKEEQHNSTAKLSFLLILLPCFLPWLPIIFIFCGQHHPTLYNQPCSLKITKYVCR